MPEIDPVPPRNALNEDAVSAVVHRVVWFQQPRHARHVVGSKRLFRVQQTAQHPRGFLVDLHALRAVRVMSSCPLTRSAIISRALGTSELSLMVER